MRAWTLVAISCGLAAGAGCGIHGDSTTGDENRTTWRIDDGLCPGTEGGCGMETPVAAGITLSVDADVLCAVRRRDSDGETRSDCDLTELDVVAAGAAELRSLSHDVTDARIDLELVTVGEGEVDLEMQRPGGERFDGITFDVRRAVAIECGRVGAAGAAWDMPSLDQTGSWTVSSTGADRVSNVELGCRLLDDRGLALLSGSAIEWRIIEGAEFGTVDDGGLFGGDSSTGARVYVRVDDRGTIRLEARFGDFTQQVEIVVD